MTKLLITDLDDTLYSWLGFFVPAFYGMVEELTSLLGISEKTILQEYKATHEQVGNVEFPYATLLLPSVQKAMPGATRQEMIEALSPAFNRYKSIRRSLLALYPGVHETLKQLCEMGIDVVAFTDSPAGAVIPRLKSLGIEEFFRTIYVAESQYPKTGHVSDKVRVVHQKKPNVLALQEILAETGCSPEEAIYIGDSLTKDIYMASQAGVTSVLYKPVLPDGKELYQKLVDITCWTDREFQREQELMEECEAKNISPDFSIKSFKQILDIVKHYI